MVISDRDFSDSALVIYDMATGRLSSGHQEDYLAAMEEALADYQPRIFAPFRLRLDGVPGIAPEDRIRRWLLGFRELRKGLVSKTELLTLVPNPGPLDFVLLFLAGVTVPWGRGKGRVAMFMRRDARGIAGWRGPRMWILDGMVRLMARRRHFHMISDARKAADYWRERTGREVLIVSIPVRKPVVSPAVRQDGRIRIGLLGAFRLEKGARHYPAVIRESLNVNRDVGVECQCPSRAEFPEESACLQVIEALATNPRVHLHRGHLDSAAYVALLYSVDIVVLPYDVASYGPGTSGVLFEAVAAGRTVVATRITWAMQEYADHPNVIWLDSVDGLALRSALDAAILRVLDQRARQAEPRIAEDSFQATWRAAIDRIGKAN